MFFKQIKAGPMQNFSYIIGDEKTKDAAVVDAGWEIDKLMEIAHREKLNITKIILTHSHYDHAQKAGELASKTNAKICFHESDYKEIKKFVVSDNKLFVNDNDEIKVGSIKLKVIRTPGHTPGGICLLAENKLLTGDTLFVNAVGRTDLPGGDAAKLFQSLNKLKKLDGNIEVYPGHDYSKNPFSTIGGEKNTNPYFMCRTKEEFLDLIS